MKRKEIKINTLRVILLYLSLLEIDIRLGKAIVNPSLYEVNHVRFIVSLLRERLSFDLNGEVLDLKGRLRMDTWRGWYSL